jgi:hypothetical protein
MYVVSIDDQGQERNFLATHISFSGHHFTATINGRLMTFSVSEIISVAAVDELGEENRPTLSPSQH